MPHNEREDGKEAHPPALPRSPESHAGSSIPTSPVDALSGLEALGVEIENTQKVQPGQARHAAPMGRRRWKKWVLVGLAAVVLLVAVGAGYLYYLAHDLRRVTVHGLHSAFRSGQEAGTENILMVGSTSRCALSVQNPAYGLCSQGVTGINSDVIMILHVDPAHHRLALLSIPRDLFVPNARSTGANKIDAGLDQGLTQVVATVEEDFGIPVQHAVSLNFDQFANIVTALGGINMAFPVSVFDWAPTGGGASGNQPVSSGLNQKAAACVHLNGTQALEVVRARHLRYETSKSNPNDPYSWPPETQSDLARIRRDHEFLRVLAAAAATHGLDNPISDLSLINSVKADISFDQTWPVNDLVNLVLDFHSVGIDSVPQLTLPVQVVNDPNGSGGSLGYDGGHYGDVEFPSETQDLAAIDSVLGIGAQIDSMSGKPLPAPASVSVSVLNGTGGANQATDTATALTALGFHIAGIGDAAPVGDVSETYIYYASRSTQAEAAAESVARSISGSVVMGYDPEKVANGAEVTVITGSQFSVNPPAPPASGKATVTTPSTTTTTPTLSNSNSSNGAIAAPNASTTKLEPWDPRACAAGATPTAPSPNPT
jgi:LCP family protein required for cell wall assembly